MNLGNAHDQPLNSQASLILTLSGRASLLKKEAYVILALIFLLFIAGGVVVYQASSITKADIQNSLGAKRESAFAEDARLTQRIADVGKEEAQILKGCSSFYGPVFDHWKATPGDAPDDHAFHAVTLQGALPTGTQIADQMEKTLGSPDLSEIKRPGLQVMIEPCGGGGTFFTILSRDQYANLFAELRAFRVPTDLEKINGLINEAAAVQARLLYLHDLERTIYVRQLETAADDQIQTSQQSAQDIKDIPLLTLVQTTLTRFGVLVIISFLVTILVPLYRYNIRLSAFYNARADALLMLGQDVDISTFITLAASLTPGLEFGKNPETPLAQIIDAAKVLQGISKPTDHS